MSARSARYCVSWATGCQESRQRSWPGVCEGRAVAKVQAVIADMERGGFSALLHENLQGPFLGDFSVFWKSSAAVPCPALGAWASVSW